MLAKFRELPLGCRFSFQGSNTEWVILERHGLGLVVEWHGNLINKSVSSICSAGASIDSVDSLIVEVK